MEVSIQAFVCCRLEDSDGRGSSPYGVDLSEAVKCLDAQMACLKGKTVPLATGFS
jgi:hypothetical protein